MNNFQLVVISNNLGRHTDVYVDFENQILEHTGWNPVKDPHRYIQRLFNLIFLPILKYRRFNFNLPSVNSSKCFFAILSGTEYSKIFFQYSFKAKLKAIYMFDPWPTLNHINENALRSYKINIAFISVKQAAEYFNSLNIPGFKAYWIPEGVHSASYKYYDYAQKNIDILQYGRQWKWIHEKLKPFCTTHGIAYEYPNDPEIN